jgi:hypothetical protein
MVNKKEREKEELKGGCIWDFRVRNGIEMSCEGDDFIAKLCVYSESY